MIKFHRAAAVAMLMLGALLAATGCTTTGAQPPAVTNTPANPDAPVNTAAPAQPTPNTTKGDHAAFCKLAQDDSSWMDAITEFSVTGEEQKAAIKKQVAEIAAAAPAELKADMDLIADTYTKIIDGELSPLPTEQKVADTVQALMRLQMWLAGNCQDS